MVETAQASGSGRRGRPGLDADAVLRRAIELFTSRGYDATSMGDLAASLGITKSAVYHHVPSKEHLLARALDEALDELSRAVDAAVRPQGEAAGHSATERLHALVRTSVAVLVAHQPAVTLLLRVRGNGPVEQAALARRRRIDDEVTALVREAMDEGGIRTDLPAPVVARLALGTVNSLVEWYRADGPLSGADLAEVLVALTFHGLAGPARPHRDAPGPTGP